MGLKFGWRAHDVRESIWFEDESLIDVDAQGKKTNRAPAAALDAWREDADASHLLPYATNGEPTIIRFRNLSPDEFRVVQAYFVDPTNSFEGAVRAWLAAFRIAIDFPGKETQADTSGSGAPPHAIVVKEHGIRMMANELVTALEENYPGIVAFYGRRILNASMATDAEKKASSPQSTQTPSSAAVPTPATTGP